MSGWTGRSSGPPAIQRGISLFLNKSRVAIIGDLLRTKRGKLREPLFMENISQERSSVQRILDLHPVVLCPGRGKPLPPSKVRIKDRIVKPVKIDARKEEEGIDVEGLEKD